MSVLPKFLLIKLFVRNIRVLLSGGTMFPCVVSIIVTFTCLSDYTVFDRVNSVLGFPATLRTGAKLV